MTDEHTKREYYLEGVLWDIFFLNQQYIISLSLRDDASTKMWFGAMQRAVQEWMKDITIYMQHPQWNEDNTQTSDIIPRWLSSLHRMPPLTHDE